MSIQQGLAFPRRRVPTGAFNPSQVTSATLLYYYDASVIGSLWKDTAGTSAVTTSGDIVLRWDDQSGNSRNATTSTNGPTYQAGGGTPYLDFDGVNDLLTHGFTISNSTTYTMVWASQTTDATAIWFTLNNGSNNIFGPRQNNGDTLTLISSTWTSSAAYVDGALATWTNRDNIHDTTNGTHVVEWNFNSNAGGGGFGINFSHGTVPLAARFYAFALFAGTLNSTDRARMTTWAGARAGLTL